MRKLLSIALLLFVMQAGLCQIKPGAGIAKRKVIVIPGVMGSVLENSDDHSIIWLNGLQLLITGPQCNDYLLALALTPDGKAPAPPFSYHCMLWSSNESGVPAKATSLFVGPWYKGLPNAYSKLVESLAKNFDVSPFAYDWRLDYRQPAEDLRHLIVQLTSDGTKSVDVVAHSQGGLVLRTYLTEYSSDPRIGTMIFIATPQLGAPKIYAILAGWEPFESYFDKVIPAMNFETGTRLAQDFPATYGLLPRFDFVVANGTLEPFEKSFHDNLQNQTLVSAADEVWKQFILPATPHVHVFAINGIGYNTLLKVHTDTHGACIFPEGDANGDGSVTYGSSHALKNVTYFDVNGKHADLPNQQNVDELITKILSGKVTSSSGNASAKGSTTTRYIRVFACGPARMQIFTAAGRRIGVDAEEKLQSEIDNAQFFRFANNDAALLPEGKYMVQLDGTGEGAAMLRVELLGAGNRLVRGFEFQKFSVQRGSRAVLPIDFSQPTMELLLNSGGKEKQIRAISGEAVSEAAH